MDRLANAFLRSLPGTTFQALSEHLTPVELARGAHVQRNHGAVPWVHFPITCVFSVISDDSSAYSVETSMVGREGALGLVEALSSRQSFADSITQIDGSALRCAASEFRRLVAGDPNLSPAVWKAVELQLAEARQSALCQAAHKVEERAARWLLESFERSGGRNPLPLIQDFLAAMLGVQRTTVSHFASLLQQKGLVHCRACRRGLLRSDIARSLGRLRKGGFAFLMIGGGFKPSRK